MADSIIQLPVDSTGKKLDTEELTVGVNSVHRERHQIAGDSPTDIAPVTAADGLTVNLGTNNDVVDTAAEASLAVIDDWDEVDRAKVNPIVGQAGVAAGAGVVGVTVQRVTLASDDPAVASLQTLDNAIAGSEMQVDIVSGSVGITGVVDTELPAAAALTDNTANPTVPGVGAFPLLWDGATWDRAPGNSADGALVNLGANNDVTVTGTVTANAGTNLNTSLLALEAGGNLASAVTALQIIDDWDETDRAKVNPIAGQAGVQGASGVVTALTQRVVLATDIGLPAGTANIGDVDVASVPSGWGKTILSAGGSASTSGNNTLVAAGTNRLKVIAFSLTTTSTTAMTCIFQSGAAGTELWRVIIQAPTGTSAGANLSTTVPGWLFATASATLLNLNLSSANAVHWSVTYFDEA